MNIMMDIETMGSGDNACITSIGAVAFNGEGVYPSDGFYRKISLKHSLQCGRSIDADTIIWWLKQSDEARNEIDCENIPENHLQPVLIALNKFITDRLTKKGSVWVNGAMFDFRILRSAFIHMNMVQTWDFRQECCMRALRAISKSFPEIESWYESKKKYFEHPNRKAVKHNAFDDAIAQACFVQQFIGGERK